MNARQRQFLRDLITDGRRRLATEELTEPERAVIEHVIHVAERRLTESADFVA